MSSKVVFLFLGAGVILVALWRLLGAGSWGIEGVQPPWGDRRSIFDHVCAHIQPGTSGLTEGGDTLPDEAEVLGEGSLRWVPGGLDGALGHHGAAGEQDKTADQILAALRRVLRRSSQRNIDNLYRSLKQVSAIDYVDPLLERIVESRGPDLDRLHEVARWIAAGAADREPVKAAIAILGVLQGYDDRELFLVLGRHEELTLYSAVAIANTMSDADRTLWELAKHVDGWGRIDIVERLAATSDTEIKAWFLRDGYRNSVMYEYLAYTCAVAGDLHDALAQDEIDETLMHGAGDILQALIDGQQGPAQGMDDYEHGALATERYLGLLGNRPASLSHLVTVSRIRGFLLDEEASWDERSNRGWTEERRGEMLGMANTYIAKPVWKDLVLAQLRSDDRSTFYLASQAATALGIDHWEEYFRRLEQGESYWFQVMQSDDLARIKRVVRLAEHRLPLDEIASGPELESGMDALFGSHGDLGLVLQDLRRFPGIGWPLIKAGMRSPVIRNRHLAILALAAWDRPSWPDEAHRYVEDCRDEEPDDKVRRRFDKLLSGQPIDG